MNRRNIVSAKIMSFSETVDGIQKTLTNEHDALDKIRVPARKIIEDVRECNKEGNKKSAEWFQSKINLIARQYQELSVLRTGMQIKAGQVQSLVDSMKAPLQEIKREVEQVVSVRTEDALEKKALESLRTKFNALAQGCNEFVDRPKIFLGLENAMLEFLRRCDNEVPKLFSGLKSLYPSLTIPSLTAATIKMPVPSAPPQELVERKEQQFSKPASFQPSYMQYNARAEGEPEDREPGQSAVSTSYQYEQKEQQSAAAPVRYAGAGVQTTAGIMGGFSAQAQQQGAGAFGHHPAPSAPVQVPVQAGVTSIPRATSFYAQFRLQYNAKKQASMSVSQQTRRVVA